MFSMVAARLLRDEICGIKNPYSKVFSPGRFHFKAGKQDFLMDVKESIKGLARGMFDKKSPRCTHLGCGLHWNAEEESWDCACHGSRFEKKGEILDNPAKKDLRF